MSNIRVPTSTPIFFGVTTRHPTSGSIQEATTTPKFWVFEQAVVTGVIAGQEMVSRTGLPGVYYGNFIASTGNGFSPETWYDVMASATVAGVTDMNIVTSVFLEKNIYYADIFIDVDTTGSLDEYTVSWMKDDTPIEEPLTSPTIQVIKRSDATDLIGQTTMTQIGSTGLLKHDSSVAANRISTGESYIVMAKASIDGSTRTWKKIIGRDN